MKTKLRLIAMLVFLSVTASVVATHSVAANGKDSEHITFTEPIVVAGTILKPGTYKLLWEGTGPQVQVSFEMGSKTLVTTGAQLVLQPSSYDGAVQVKTLGDNSKVLEKISWKKKALVFAPSS